MPESLALQEMIRRLNAFWAEQGCVIATPYGVEVGAGTMNPATYLRCLGPEPWNVAYVEPSRRPADSRYGQNPNRLFQHYQYQVIMKPSPDDIVDRYLACLQRLGIDPRVHDIRLVEDNWEAPTLGAWGLGWEIWSDGMEITQFTWFQQVGGYDCRPVPVEITIGLERLGTYIQDVPTVFDVEWAPGITYGELRGKEEFEQSKYALDVADVPTLRALFDAYEREGRRAFDAGLVLPGYDYCLKCSHVFNLLDARGAVAVTERPHLLGRVRNLARAAADGWLAQREALGWPLLKGVRDDAEAG